MKRAIIFAGQGSQYPGMGKDLYEKYQTFRDVIDEAENFLEFGLKEKMFEANEEELSRTETIQPVMAAFAYGITEVLKEKGFVWDYCAGLSLGEYSALAAAGVFDLKSLIRITSIRGKAMQEAGAGLDTKMAAVIGGKEERIGEICAQACELTGKYVTVANYNSKGQVVISGIREAAEEAIRMLKEDGLKCIPLKVSSAFHTKFMEPASARLKDYFAKEESFGVMEIPVVFNVTGRELGEDESINELLEKQVMCPVQMRKSLEYLASCGVEEIIEVGPGKVISGFVRKTIPEVGCISAEEYLLSDASR